MTEYLNQKPSGHHDFRADKGVKECAVCSKPKEAHTEYERVKVIGEHGTRLAWRIREGK
jgi:hypothetical protein